MPSATAVRERPILFSGEMVRAILDGRKTQTRRVVKLPPWSTGEWDDFEYDGLEALAICENTGCLATVPCPYGQPGDRLWVKETFASPQSHIVAYQADGECGAWIGDGAGGRFWNRHGGVVDRRVPARDESWRGESYGLSRYGGKWTSSRFMPRWASRLTLEITEVRVGRLREISDDDIRAEGFPDWMGTISADESPFAALWDSLNAKRGYSWDANPFVWVIGFRKAGTP